MAADLGPPIERFAIPEDLPELYRWEVGNASTPDGVAVLNHQGGTDGAWILLRRPDKGDDLTGWNETISVGGNRWRVVPAGCVIADATLTLGPTNAATGDWIEVTRFCTNATSYAIVNGGPAGGTLVTLPRSTRAFAVLYFDEGNWLLRRSGTML
jgi:hypothetical protein